MNPVSHFTCVTKVALGVGFRAKRKSALEATKFYCELNGLVMEAKTFSVLLVIYTEGLTANVFPTKDLNAEEMLTKGFNDHFVDIERTCIDYS